LMRDSPNSRRKSASRPWSVGQVTASFKVRLDDMLGEGESPKNERRAPLGKAVPDVVPRRRKPKPAARDPSQRNTIFLDPDSVPYDPVLDDTADMLPHGELRRGRQATPGPGILPQRRHPTSAARDTLFLEDLRIDTKPQAGKAPRPTSYLDSVDPVYAVASTSSSGIEPQFYGDERATGYGNSNEQIYAMASNNHTATAASSSPAYDVASTSQYASAGLSEAWENSAYDPYAAQCVRGISEVSQESQSSAVSSRSIPRTNSYGSTMRTSRQSFDARSMRKGSVDLLRRASFDVRISQGSLDFDAPSEVFVGGMSDDEEAAHRRSSPLQPQMNHKSLSSVSISSLSSLDSPNEVDEQAYTRSRRGSAISLV